MPLLSVYRSHSKSVIDGFIYVQDTASFMEYLNEMYLEVTARLQQVCQSDFGTL